MKSKQNNKNLLSISVVIPTYNSGKYLKNCLDSIITQDYPKELVEILIIDGGSSDNTIKIAKEYTGKIYKNSLKTGEAGKAVGVKNAKNDLIALIDSDNILPSKEWLKRMVVPFRNKEIIGSEPWRFKYRTEDGFIDRYCALMGMNDPLCYFMGNYDKLCIVTGKWTGLDIKQKDHKNWVEIEINTTLVPTIGANGTIIRRNVLLKSGLVGDYFFDIDIIAELARNKMVKFAKVKNSIIHIYCGNDIGKFYLKQKRRITDYLYFKKLGIRKYQWQKQSNIKITKFVLSCLIGIPLVYQLIKGYLKRKDNALFFHPLACWLTLIVYSSVKIYSIFKISEISREGWKQ